METVECNKKFAERGREMVVMPRKEETKALFMDFYECNFTTERLYITYMKCSLMNHII